MHADAAVKDGAAREEVLEALGVAIAINAGIALVHPPRAMDACTARSAEPEATRKLPCP
jgi:alkylhydroperoxidase/carboxymuconolactone decarboxylase family protein YurZ